jgi:regulator of sigma D
MYYIAAKPNQLQCDLDTKQSRKTFRQQLSRLRRHGHIKILSVVKHKSKSGNTHATVTLSRNYPLIERITLQLLLGSDVVRELCNYGRAKNSAPVPVLFLSKRKRQL